MLPHQRPLLPAISYSAAFIKQYIYVLELKYNHCFQYQPVNQTAEINMCVCSDSRVIISGVIC